MDIKKNSTALWIILFWSILITLVVTSLYGYYPLKNTPNYIEASEIISSGNFENLQELNLTPSTYSRFFRPMQALIISIYPPLREEIFYFSNVIFIFLTSVLVFYIALEFRLGRTRSLLSAILYNCSMVVLHFGYSLMAEGGTHFFYALTIYLILRYYHKYHNSSIFPIVISFICGVATLMKENAGMGIVFLFLLIFFDKGRFKFIHFFRNRLINKFLFLGIISLIFFIPFIINQIITAHLLQYSYIDWSLFIAGAYKFKNKFTIFRFFLTYISAFSILLPFFVYYYVLIMLNKVRSNKLIVNCLLLSGILVPFLYREFFDRYAFLAFPLIIPFGLVGLKIFLSRHVRKRHRQALLLLFIILFIILNFAAFVLYRYPAAYHAVLSIVGSAPY